MTTAFNFEVVPPEILLARAPLERVLCQIRFSPVPELVEAEAESAIAELLEEEFPVRGTIQGFTVQLAGFQAPAETYRTFEDTEGTWKVTVAPEFVALETSRYGQRSAFVSRLVAVLGAVARVRRPPQVKRVGVRYTDRILDPAGLTDLVHPALLGWLPSVETDSVVNHQIVQVLLQDVPASNRIQVRSLFLPPGVVFDPSVPAVQEKSWVLDIDAYNEDLASFDPEVLGGVVSTLAERAYQVFYWSVTDDFRKLYGAESDGGS